MQWCCAIDRLHIYAGTLMQPLVHNLCMAEARGKVQRGAAIFRLRLDVCLGGDEVPNDVRVASTGGHVQWCHAVPNLRLKVGFALQEPFEDIRVTSSGSGVDETPMYGAPPLRSRRRRPGSPGFEEHVLCLHCRPPLAIPFFSPSALCP